MKKYYLMPSWQLLQDEKSVNFHVYSDDYFATLAAILKVIKEKISDQKIIDSQIIIVSLENLITDLLFLQNNYFIVTRVYQGQAKK